MKPRLTYAEAFPFETICGMRLGTRFEVNGEQYKLNFRGGDYVELRCKDRSIRIVNRGDAFLRELRRK